MPDRLSALDASFLYLEDEATPMHVGGVAVFRRPRSGLDYAQLVALIRQRLPLLPRYRRRVAEVPGNLARPVWVDDPAFDVTYHVRRSALPAPGSHEQLFDLVARLMARPLDQSRPLWEAYLVEGLAGGHIALITKTHQALVDGIRSIDFGQVILAGSPSPPEVGPDEPWEPRRPPGAARLVLDAVSEAVHRPREVVENVRSATTDLLSTTRKVAGAVGAVATSRRIVGAVGAVGGTVGLLVGTGRNPLNVTVGKARRFAVARASLSDLRRVRADHGGTVHDVVLAVVAGALRSWLLSRGERVTPSTRVRALVPMAVRVDGAPLGADLAAPASGLVGSAVTAHLVDLPVGQAHPLTRLRHVTHAMRHLSGRSMAASALLRLSGFAPPTLHSLGARAAASFSHRVVDVVVTNVPGPQVPLYAGTARMTEMFPVMPLGRNQAMAIGVTSYDGGVYFGLTGDRAALPDVEALAGMVETAVDELMTTVRA